jgi:hypothetical protein
MGKMSRLYDDDFHAWTEVQAEALRKLAARPDLSNVIDWDNIIEEVETLGRSDLRAAEAYLVQCLAHLIKLVSAPGSHSAGKWHSEIRLHQSNFQQAFAASMRRKISLDVSWKHAINYAEAGLWPEGLKPSRALPQQCPFALDEILAEFDVDRLIAKLSSLLNRSMHGKHQ